MRRAASLLRSVWTDRIGNDTQPNQRQHITKRQAGQSSLRLTRLTYKMGICYPVRVRADGMEVTFPHKCSLKEWHGSPRLLWDAMKKPGMRSMDRLPR